MFRMDGGQVTSSYPYQGSSQRGNPQTSWASAMQTSSLPDLLGRPSLHYADQASAMQTGPPLCSKRASTIQHSFHLQLLCHIWIKTQLFTMLGGCKNRCRLDDIWIISGWFLDDFWMISGWFLNDFWMISGWYLDDIWVISGWWEVEF